MQFGSVCSGKSRTGRPAIDLLGQRLIVTVAHRAVDAAIAAQGGKV